MMKRSILLCLLALMLAFGLSGCSVMDELSENKIVDTIFGEGISDEEFLARNAEVGESVVVIMGNHANAIRPNIDEIQKALEPILEKTITYSIVDGEDYCANINLYVIVCDGNPEQVTLIEEYDSRTGEGWELELDLSAKSVELLDKEIVDAKERIYECLAGDNLKANDPQSDLHRALSMARNILWEKIGESYARGEITKKEEQKAQHILVFDNGIVTAGYLNMNAIDIQSGSAEEVVGGLSNAHILDLEGISIRFIGLANSCGSQVNIKKDPTVAETFLAFWREYLKACKPDNADSLKFILTISEAPGTKLSYVEGEADSYPEVDNVAFKMTDLPEAPEGGGKKGDDGDTTKTTVVFPTTALYFEANSSEFKDQAKAERTLLAYEAYFSELKEHPEITIYVVGSVAKTAPGEVLRDSTISAGRANAIKQLICEVYDIPAAQIQTIDAGSQEYTWRNAKEFPDGTMESKDANAMQENRTVAIIPSTRTAEVQELIAAGELPAN